MRVSKLVKMAKNGKMTILEILKIEKKKSHIQK